MHQQLRLRRSGLQLSLLILLLTACTTNQPRRPVTQAESASLPAGFGPFFNDGDQRVGANNVVWGVSVLEFDDQGELWDDSQIERVGSAQLLGAVSGGQILVVYVHGWKHTASVLDEKNGNLHDFIEFVRRVAADQPVGEERLVHGVYISWRGDSIPLPEPIKSLSYYDRNAAAERIAGPATTEMLYHVMSTGLAPNSRVIVIGHSMGAKIVERALIPAYESQLIDPRANTNPCDDTAQPWRPPADLVLLLNPASPAIEAKKFVDMLNRRRIRYDAQPARYVCTRAANGWRPLIISVTSESDTANRRAFPMGNLLSHVFARTRHYSDWRLKYSKQDGLARLCCGDESRVITDEYVGDKHFELPPQRYFLTHTAGFATVLHTHRLVHQHRDVPSDMCAAADCDLLPPMTIFPAAHVMAGTACFSRGHDRFILQELGYRYNTTPYWIMQAPKTMMSGHNDIFNDVMYDFIRGLLDFTGVLESGATERLVPTGGEDEDIDLEPQVEAPPVPPPCY